MQLRYLYILLLAASTSSVQAQKLKKEDRQAIESLQKHVQYLSSDSLQGRKTGSKGGQMAMEYIAAEFQKAGLEAKGTNGFYQPFELDKGFLVAPATFFSVGGTRLELYKDYFPLPFSSRSSLEAQPSMAIQEMQMPWFLDIKELAEAHAQDEGLYAALKEKARESARKGATALLVYNSSAKEDGLAFDGKKKEDTLSIPVVYLTQPAMKKYFKDPQAFLDIKLNIDIEPKKLTGNNVLGFIDNKAATTVILGAHYDHLGLGEDGKSLDDSAAGKIHNGADDNASGVAGLLELARLLKASALNRNNYLFIAFAGEEQGLSGSQYFINHSIIDLNSVNYMINMDMIGRLNDSTHLLTVGGFGTSPAWAEAYAARGKKGLYTGSLKFQFDSSGIGPSDHTSFYFKNIPVLFYYTGMHSDYHRPSDDAEKINYTGENEIVRHIFSLIQWQNKAGNKLAFNSTKGGFGSTDTPFSVTLGIRPDYSFSGQGVRIDHVSENRPAQKAGLQQGDVIFQLGDYPVPSLEYYMQALSRFKKGEKATVQFSRGSQKLSATVEF